MDNSPLSVCPLSTERACGRYNPFERCEPWSIPVVACPTNHGVGRQSTVPPAVARCVSSLWICPRLAIGEVYPDVPYPKLCAESGIDGPYCGPMVRLIAPGVRALVVRYAP